MLEIPCSDVATENAASLVDKPVSLSALVVVARPLIIFFLRHGR